MPEFAAADGDPNQVSAPPSPAYLAPPPTAARPGTLGHFRPLRKLAMATCILLGLAATASAVFALARYNRVTAVRRFLIDRDELAGVDQADNLARGSFWLTAVVFLATGIVFIIWQYKYTRNAELLHGPLGLGAGWAIGGWFIPVANLVLPFIQLNHAAKASDPHLSARRHLAWRACTGCDEGVDSRLHRSTADVLQRGWQPAL